MRLKLPLIAFGVAAALYLSGATNLVERELMDGRFEMLHRQATGDLVVVAIDPKSLAKLDQWPWPRTLHAAMIRRLVAAGAKTIALDIDFSSRSSSPAADAALADAIAENSGRIVLPVFRQKASGTPEPEDGVHVTRPLPALRAAAQLATVTVRPDSDGLVRRALQGERIGGVRYPSLAAVLAGRSGTAGPFFIDYGIAATSIPNLSFADVLAGRFDPRAIAGKSVIVGATAVELGDRLAVPLYRSLPGPVVQALAYESLVQGRAIHALQPWAILAVALLLVLALDPIFVRISWRWGLATLVAIAAACYGASIGIQAAWPISVDITPWVLAAALCFGANVVRALERQARELLLQGMEVLSKGAMLRGVIEDSFDGIAITDPDGVIEMFNGSAGQMLNCRPDDVIGGKIQSVLPLPAELAVALDAGGAVPPSFAASCEIELPTTEGTSVAIELVVSTSSIRSRHRAREARRVLIFTFHNVSERRNALAAQVAATKEAMAANRAKSEFLTNMSHELRTPLNAIIGFSEMMREQVFGPIGDAHYLNYAKDIHDSGSHLRDLVNDILDVSKIEAGKQELNEEPLDLSQIADSCLRIVGSRAQQGGLRLGTDLPPGPVRLIGDERMVKQCLLNLLSNAIKFTPESGTVSLAASHDADGSLALRVADTGIGIAADHLPHISEPFYQADGSLARTHEGTGLGLYLVHKFMALHGGKLEIDSEPGKGTAVTLLFPAERTMQENGATEAA